MEFARTSLWRILLFTNDARTVFASGSRRKLFSGRFSPEINCDSLKFSGVAQNRRLPQGHTLNFSGRQFLANTCLRWHGLWLRLGRHRLNLCLKYTVHEMVRFPFGCDWVVYMVTYDNRALS